MNLLAQFFLGGEAFFLQVSAYSEISMFIFLNYSQFQRVLIV